MNNLLTPDTNLALLSASQSNSATSSQNLKAAAKAKDLEQIDDVAHEFEAVFLSEMLKPMFQELKTDGMFGGGKGEEVFRSFLLKEYGDIMSQAGGIGLADHVKEQIIQMQEQQTTGNEFAEISLQQGQNNDINNGE